LWIVGITTGFAIVSVIAALVVTEVYRAEVVIIPVSEEPGGRRLGALARQFGGLAGVDVGAMAGGGGNELAVPYLKSRSLASQFIEQHNLIPVLFQDALADEPPTLWMATQMFVRNVRSVTMEPATGLVTVSVEWTDPVTAAEWANGLVSLVNENLRERARSGAERNISYMNARIEETSIVPVQQMMFNLIENELKTVMLANAREEYAFNVVDHAVPPEMRSRPQRTLMVILGTMFGGFLSLILIGFRRLIRNLNEQVREADQRPTP
jgi:uncharacterized protein involved in exopolysaccharide biosynthesis